MIKENLEADHTPQAIRERLAATPKPSYLRDWVYGGIDGAVTTFAIMAGVVGADLNTSIILVLGLANLFADGFSMAAGNFSGTRAEIDHYRRLQAIERRHIAEVPDGEREEVRELLRQKGLTGDALEQATASLTADHDRWVDIMMQEEHGLSNVVRSPMKAALSTFAAFALCGAVPIIPYALGLPHAFTASIIATATAFAAIGAMKSRWSLSPAWWSAGETLAIGSTAALVAYAVGYALRNIT